MPLLSLALLAGCRQDMHDQPRYGPLARSRFFRDESSARHFPEGTIARGHLREDRVFYTGILTAATATTPAVPVREFPFPVTKEVLLRGQERYNIYCSPCHAATGQGNGMIVQRGFTHPPSFHTQRLRDAAPGHIYDVITNGFGAMYSYASRVEPRDRWAVAAYIRALQATRTGPPDPDPRGAAAIEGIEKGTGRRPSTATGQQPEGAQPRGER